MLPVLQKNRSVGEESGEDGVPWVTCRNEPNVHESRQDANPAGWQGTELSVTILGNWQYYRAKILKYLRQIAVITPYAQFAFAYIAEDEKNSLRINFVRRTNKMPKPPKVRSLPSAVQAALPRLFLHQICACSHAFQFSV